MHSLVVVASDRFGSGTAVDLPGAGAHGRRPAGRLVDARYRTVDGAVVRIDLPGEPGEGVWFTEVHHAGAAVPSVSLHAWTGAAGAAGELLAPGAEAGATHVGVVRWWLRSGLVATVRVEQGARGRGLGTAPPCWAPRLARRTHRLAAEREPGTATGVARLLADLPTRII